MPPAPQSSASGGPTAGSRSFFLGTTDRRVLRMAAKGWFLPAFFLVTMLCMAGMYYYLNSGSVEISNRHAQRMPPTGELRSQPPRGYFAQREARDRKKPTSTKQLQANEAQQAKVKNKTKVPVDVAVAAKAPKSNVPKVNEIPSVVAREEQVAVTRTINPSTKTQPTTEQKNLPAESESTANRGSLLRRWNAFADGINQRLMLVATTLDHEAVRWRSNIGRSALVQGMAAWALFHDGDISAAEKQIDRALATWPQNEQLLNSKIEMARATNRWRRAAEGYVALAEARPTDPQPRYNAAVVYSRLGQFGAANLWFDRTLDVDPQHAKALYNLAAVAQYGGRMSEAEELWARLTDAHPNVISAWYQRGAIAFDLGNYPEASFAFEQVIRIDPTEADAYVNLGETQLVVGNLEAAHKSIATALEIDACHDAALASMIDVCEVLAAWFPARRGEYQQTIATCHAQLDAMGLAPTMYADAAELDDDRGLSLEDYYGDDDDSTVSRVFDLGAGDSSSKKDNVFAGSDTEASGANRSALE